MRRRRRRAAAFLRAAKQKTNPKTPTPKKHSTWIAKPLGGGTSAWLPRPKLASVAPPAILICACTMSTPVTSSVTVCSTCTRGFTSRK